MQSPRKMETRLGLVVFVALVVLKGIEYALSVSLHRGALLFIVIAVLALVSATFVIYYFMHVKQLWHEED